jgi:hypothetical protein
VILYFEAFANLLEEKLLQQVPVEALLKESMNTQVQGVLTT